MTDHKFTDEEVIKGLECLIGEHILCKECAYSEINGGFSCKKKVATHALDLINRQKAEIERLEYTLTGVMHSVDKWLDGSELKQGEVNRAVTMREKTLQIVERLEEENEFLSSFDADEIRAEAIKEFAERLKEKLIKGGIYPVFVKNSINDLVKELTEVEK